MNADQNRVSRSPVAPRSLSRKASIHAQLDRDDQLGEGAPIVFPLRTRPARPLRGGMARTLPFALSFPSDDVS